MSKHTPGPWRVSYSSEGSPRSILRANGELSVECNCAECSKTGYNRQYDELVTCDSHVYGPTRQDAELMAAAPDLLAACKEAEALLSSAGFSTFELRAAIAKAERGLS